MYGNLNLFFVSSFEMKTHKYIYDGQFCNERTVEHYL